MVCAAQTPLANARNNPQERASLFKSDSHRIGFKASSLPQLKGFNTHFQSLSVNHEGHKVTRRTALVLHTSCSLVSLVVDASCRDCVTGIPDENARIFS